MRYQSASARVRERYASKLVPFDSLDPVMLGESIVQVGVFAVQQFQNIAVFLNDSLNKEFRFFAHSIAQFLIESREATRIWLNSCQVTQV